MKKIVLLIPIFSSLLFLIACSDDPDDAEPTISSIEISAVTNNEIVLGEPRSLSITAFDQSGNPISIDSEIVWTSTNSNITVTEGGIVTGMMEGTAVITATVEELEASEELTVVDISAQDYHIYVSDAGDFESPPWQILRYDQNGDHPKVFISENLGWPQDILFLEDRNEVLISNLNSGRINRYNATTGEFIDIFSTVVGGPTRMKIGSDDLLYVLQWQGDGTVLRYDLDGNFVDEFTSIQVIASIGLDWDTSGNLYVSSFSGRFVRKFSSTGEDMGLFITSGLAGPTNIWFDAQNNLLVNDWESGKIVKYDSDGNFIQDVATGLSQVEGIAQLPSGNMLIGNGGTGSVKEFTSAGSLVGDFISPRAGGLIQPNAVVRRDL